MAYFAEITAIELPSSADEGELVDVIVKVRNLVTAGSITIAVTGVYNYTNPLPQPPILVVPPGEIGVFPMSFIMPGRDTTINVGSWYKGTSGNFVQDDLAETSIALATEEPQPGVVQLVSVNTYGRN